MYPYFKRFFDLFFTSLGVLILSPLLIPIFIALKITDEGEVFYFQERIGYNFKLFKIFKFATMLKNSPSIGNKTVTIIEAP